MNIGILALQGAFAEHGAVLKKLGCPSFEIRSRADLKKDFDGLIIPGGESTVQGKLLRELGLFDPLKEKILAGLPVFGTCAGLILLASKISGGGQTHFATMDITVRRNAYGRQLGSFYTEGDFNHAGKIPMTFIRAPCIESASPSVEVLASVEGKIAAARQGNQLVCAFHPELTDDLSVHRYFLEIVLNYEGGKKH